MIIGFAVFACVSERVQFWVPGRTPLISDFITDMIGVLIGLLIGLGIRWAISFKRE